MRLAVAVAVVAGLLSGCGGLHAGTTAAPVASDAPARAGVAGKHVEQGSGKLAMTIDPAAGPAGTVVVIRATDCLDADGQNHAVSFNPGMANLRPDAPVDSVRANLTGETLTAQYTITRADTRGSGHGRFFVQCATDIRDLPFTITKDSPVLDLAPKQGLPRTIVRLTAPSCLPSAPTDGRRGRFNDSAHLHGPSVVFDARNSGPQTAYATFRIPGRAAKGLAILVIFCGGETSAVGYFTVQ